MVFLHSAIEPHRALDSKKVEGYYYDETYSKRREVTGLPFLIIAGIKAEFKNMNSGGRNAPSVLKI